MPTMEKEMENLSFTLSLIPGDRRIGVSEGDGTDPHFLARWDLHLSCEPLACQACPGYQWPAIVPRPVVEPNKGAWPLHAVLRASEPQPLSLRLSRRARVGVLVKNTNN